MQQIHLTEQISDSIDYKQQLFPFTATRHMSDIRVGILTIREKWEYVGADVLDHGEPGDKKIAANLVPSNYFLENFRSGILPDAEGQRTISFPWEIFQLNDWAIRQDYELITNGRKSEPIQKGTYANNESQIFIEEGASVGSCWLNASSGPIYIGRNAVVMDGTMIMGPVAICEGAVIKMGTKIYGATTIGPRCVAGGEIKNSMMMGYSNKAHDGYLGDSVLGEWCNLGAGTSNSNMKNTAGDVSMWVPSLNASKVVGNKCGLIMGDYSRASINTSFNTGTMVGVCANVFGSGLTPKYIPSFSWGTDGTTKASIDKTLEHITNWKKLKQKELTEPEVQALRHIFAHSKF